MERRRREGCHGLEGQSNKILKMSEDSIIRVNRINAREKRQCQVMLSQLAKAEKAYIVKAEKTIETLRTRRIRMLACREAYRRYGYRQMVETNVQDGDELIGENNEKHATKMGDNIDVFEAAHGSLPRSFANKDKINTTDLSRNLSRIVTRADSGSLLSSKLDPIGENKRGSGSAVPSTHHAASTTSFSRRRPNTTAAHVERFKSNEVDEPVVNNSPDAPKPKQFILAHECRNASAFRAFMDKKVEEVLGELTPTRMRQNRVQLLLEHAQMPQLVDRKRRTSKILADFKEHMRGSTLTTI